MLATGKILSRQRDDLRLRLVDAQPVEVLLDQCASSSGFIYKSNELRSARQSFYPDRAGSGAQIQKSGIVADPRGQYIKKRLAKPVRRRPRPAIRWAFQDTPAIRACNNAHNNACECGTRNWECGIRLLLIR